MTETLSHAIESRYVSIIAGDSAVRWSAEIYISINFWTVAKKVNSVQEMNSGMRQQKSEMIIGFKIKRIKCLKELIYK